GRSVPAPGKGVLTSAREVSGNALASAGQLLDIGYRSKQLSRRKAQIDEWLASEHKQVLLQGLPQDIYGQHMSFIETEAQRQISEALDTWGNAFWKHNSAISPLRGSLAVWGLSVDDIGIASFHGTSTKANDKNESEIIDRQLEHLGRTPGNPVFAICQKYLTGHPKGPASIWMLNGILQSLSTGIIPGNRNADNIAPELEKCRHIVYPSRSIQSPGIKAGLLKSFGFGQVGAECLVVHPDYLFATLKQKQLDCYREKVSKRQATTYRYWHNVLADVHPMVQIKDQPPYSAEQEEEVYLNPLARLGQSGFK
ncbi:fatty acid synthase alpha subunit Lsd1, partial [Coemansia sp. RSA 2603]